ncbi:MAG: hypothetical protein WKF75_20665 [Singulisphaera sp.]
MPTRRKNAWLPSNVSMIALASGKASAPPRRPRTIGAPAASRCTAGDPASSDDGACP